MGLIGQTWTHRKVRRLLVLIDQNKHTKPFKHQGLENKHKHEDKKSLSLASTTQYLTQHTQPDQVCSTCLSVAYSSRETPGPIPNPEAKPARADGTATGRLWESKKPPTLNNTYNSINKAKALDTHHGV